jgi:hypothetical protein
VTICTLNKNSKIPLASKVDVGGELWKEILDENYEITTDTEFNRLNILFQRRHLLNMPEGIVDEKYTQIVIINIKQVKE